MTTNAHIDAVFRKWAGANDHGAPYLCCYAEQFRHIARDIAAPSQDAFSPEQEAELSTLRRVAKRIGDDRYALAAQPTAQPSQDAAPFTMYTVSAGGYAERWIARKDARGLIEPIDGPWRVTLSEARAHGEKGSA